MSRGPKTYWVYILTNAKTTVLYVGVTSDLERRMAEHAERTDPSSFTARYNVTRLVRAEPYPDVRDAIAREKQVKGWTRAKKRGLVDAANPAWRDLREGTRALGIGGRAGIGTASPTPAPG